MNPLRKILFAGVITGLALPAFAESLDKLVPQATEIFERFKREEILNKIGRAHV